MFNKNKKIIVFLLLFLVILVGVGFFAFKLNSHPILQPKLNKKQNISKSLKSTTTSQQGTTTPDFPDLEQDIYFDPLYGDIEKTLKAGLNPGIDTDGDHLLNYEEIEIYHTDPRNPDTDGDGYKDGEEVFKGYNPLGTGKLKF